MKKVFIRIIFSPVIILIAIIVSGLIYLVADMYIAKSRAARFCEIASQNKTSEEIKNLLKTTKGFRNTIFLDGIISIQFPLALPEYFSCNIQMDQNGRSVKFHITHKD